jgi:hypothetical protein
LSEDRHGPENSNPEGSEESSLGGQSHDLILTRLENFVSWPVQSDDVVSEPDRENVVFLILSPLGFDLDILHADLWNPSLKGLDHIDPGEFV